MQDDIAAIARIDAVPGILDLVCQVTGMGFAAIARVTDERWIACSVKDEIGFGLEPGGELKVETTICHEVRQCRQAVVIDHVALDPVWRDHHTPALYGFHLVRDRSEAGCAGHAAGDRDVPPVRRADRLPP